VLNSEVGVDQILAFFDIYGVIVLFIVMSMKSLGLPIPIPVDVILVGVAVRAAQGQISIVALFAAAMCGAVLGGMCQFLLIRGPARHFMYTYGHFVGITPRRLEYAATHIRTSSAIGIGLACIIPGLRTVALPACGLADIPPRRVAFGLTFGNTLMLGGYLTLGYRVGLLLHH
jgi:membrane protein DedA with SNARE-associated domain